MPELKAPLRLAALLAVLLGALMLVQAPQATEAPLPDGVTEQLHGVSVKDADRWLEDMASSEVRAWVAQQTRASRRHLDALPEQPRFAQRLGELWDYPRQGLPKPTRSGALLYEHNDGLQEQPVLVLDAGDGSGERVLLDPNREGKNGIPLSLSDYALSPDGRWLAYALAESGSDWSTIRVRSVASGEDHAVRLSRVRFSRISWTHDSQGFFYSRFPAGKGANAFAALSHQQLRYHRLGDDAEDDILVFANPVAPQQGFSARVSDGGRWLFIYSWEGTRHNLVHAVDLGDEATPRLHAPPQEIIASVAADYDVIGSHGQVAYVLTNDRAPRGRIVAIDLLRPQRQHWREVLPESADVLRSARHVGGRLVVHALRDAASVLRVIDENGKAQREITLPALGSVVAISGRVDDPHFYYAFSSATRPQTNYRVDLRSGAREQVFGPRMDWDAADYATRRGFAEAPDGTRIPVFVSHRRDLSRESGHPTILHAYGGFNVAMTPRFSVPAMAWMEAGGVWVTAALRGGGEYGSDWHEAGIRHNKGNTLDDLAAVADWLFEERLTTPAQLALHGASNGGMVVGAAVNRYPEKFAASVPSVGVMDLLRFHRFTIGRAWASDYGSPEQRADFDNLLDLSPYHNIRDGARYPATLVVTRAQDDRVAPAHSYKYAARLQRAQADPLAPVLLRVDAQGGHGAGDGMQARIDEWADILAFVSRFTAINDVRASAAGPRVMDRN